MALRKVNLLVWIFAILVCSAKLVMGAPAPVEVRIGWQVPWAIQGQLVAVLKNTDILAKNGIAAKFIGKTYGPELNELALAGQVDVILTADQPAAILFAHSNAWMGIARLMYNRTSTYVPPASPIASVADLKGKTVGVPFGAAAERVVKAAVAEAGVSSSSVSFINLGMLEHAPLAQRAGKADQKWGQFDALSGFDPVPALLDAKGLVKTIHSGKVCALVVASKVWAEKDQKSARALVKALSEAWDYYRTHKQQVNDWYFAEAKVERPSDAALKLMESFEPNFKESPARVSFLEDDFILMQKGADFAQAVTKKKVNMREFVSNRYIRP